MNFKLNVSSLNVVTHSGGFHSDEIFATALIKKFVCDNIKIIRTRDKGELDVFKKESSVWVVDVGGEYSPSMKNFDHHQLDFSECWIGTDILYSSCGLVWQYLKANGYLKELTHFQIQDIEEKLIKKIDMHDNGVSSWKPAIVFKLFNRPNNELVGFSKAVDVALSHINNTIYYSANEQENESMLYDHKYLASGKVVVVAERAFNVTSSIMSNTNASIMVEKKEDGMWSVQGLNRKFKMNEIMSTLPDSVHEDVIFIHRAGHLVRTLNKSSAIDIAMKMASSK